MKIASTRLSRVTATMISTTTSTPSSISTLSAKQYTLVTQDSSKYNLQVAVAFERTSLGFPSYVVYLKKNQDTWLRVTQ